jgi:hypothetical protein
MAILVILKLELGTRRPALSRSDIVQCDHAIRKDSAVREWPEFDSDKVGGVAEGGEEEHADQDVELGRALLVGLLEAAEFGRGSEDRDLPC